MIYKEGCRSDHKGSGDYIQRCNCIAEFNSKSLILTAEAFYKEMFQIFTGFWREHFQTS